MSIFYGTLPLTSGVKTFADIGAAGISGCLIGNESGLTCIVTMQGSNLTKSLYPGTVDWFPVGRGFTGIVQIDPSTQLANLSAWPSQFVQIDVYGSNEQPGGVYPLTLTRANNIGNSITTSGGATTSDTVKNDTSPTGTVFVEATVAGDLASGVTITNNGAVVLGNSGRHGSIRFESGGDFFINGPGTIGGDVLFFSTLTSGLGFFVGGTTAIDAGAIATDGFGTMTLTNGNQLTFNGPTSGSVTFNTMFSGTVKIVTAKFSNYQNNTASVQTFTFPSSLVITAPSLWIATEIPGMQGFLSGVGQQINIITALAAGGGTTVAQNTIQKASIGYFRTTNIDSLKDTINDVNAHSGQLFIVSLA